MVFCLIGVVRKLFDYIFILELILFISVLTALFLCAISCSIRDKLRRDGIKQYKFFVVNLN